MEFLEELPGKHPLAERQLISSDRRCQKGSRLRSPAQSWRGLTEGCLPQERHDVFSQQISVPTQPPRARFTPPPAGDYAPRVPEADDERASVLGFTERQRLAKEREEALAQDKLLFKVRGSESLGPRLWWVKGKGRGTLCPRCP
jgi:hypothetical protein